MFGWLRGPRRADILEAPIPDGWPALIAANVPGYAGLNEAQRAKLTDDTRVFVAQKKWAGGRGVTVTDAMKVTIAAQACLLVLGMDADASLFSNVRRVVVLEHAYQCYEVFAGDMHARAVLGHTDAGGPVHLAWDWVHHGGRDPRDGRNLVLHEFAHKLDLANGVADGTPPLDGREDFETWVDVMTHAYDHLCGLADDGKRTVLDAYGATNPAEFFAVATEVFFEKPRVLKRKRPALYTVLSHYYRQDPAGPGSADAARAVGEHPR